MSSMDDARSTAASPPTSGRPGPVVAYAPASLPSYEAEEHHVVPRSDAALRARVTAAGGRLIVADAPIVDGAGARRASDAFTAQGADLVVLQCASFAMGDIVEPFARAGHRLCLWAPDEPRRDGPIPLNGFVAMHLHAGVLRTALHHLGARYAWCFGDAGNPLFEGRIRTVLDGVRIAAALNGARIGRIGEVAPSFLNVASDPDAVARWTGARTERLPLQPLLHRAHTIVTSPSAADAQALHDATAEIRAVATAVEVSDDDLARNVAVYLALRETVDAHGLAALAVRDWPEFQSELALHPGLAMSWLDHRDGVPVAAEGDVGGALSMLAARAAGRAPAMLLDVNDLDVERDALLTWHCGGSPLAIADRDGVRWTPHTTLARGETPAMGTVADLRFAEGPVTLLRVGRDGARWFVVEGEVVPSPHAGFDGSRGWVGAFRGPDGPLTARDVAETLISRGVEHHLALVPGHHAAAVRTAAGLLGAEVDGMLAWRDEPRFATDAPTPLEVPT